MGPEPATLPPCDGDPRQRQGAGAHRTISRASCNSVSAGGHSMRGAYECRERVESRNRVVWPGEPRSVEAASGGQTFTRLRGRSGTQSSDREAARAARPVPPYAALVGDEDVVLDARDAGGGPRGHTASS